MSFTSLSRFRPPLFTLAAGRVLGLWNATYDSLSVWCTSILWGVIRPVGHVWFLRWWVFLPRRIESGSQTLVWRLDVCKLSVRGDSNINLTLKLRRTSVTIKVQQGINFGWKWKTAFIFPQGAANIGLIMLFFCCIVFWIKIWIWGNSIYSHTYGNNM